MSRGKGTVNKVILVGRLGKDPEIRYTTSGQASASFSLATNAVWKDQSGSTQERTDWHNIKAWGRLAEVMGEYLKKGNLIYLEGRLQTRSYDDASGVKKWITEVVVNDMEMLGSRGGGNMGSDSSSQPMPQAPPPANGGQEDDLPF